MVTGAQGDPNNRGQELDVSTADQESYAPVPNTDGVDRTSEGWQPQEHAPADAAADAPAEAHGDAPPDRSHGDATSQAARADAPPDADDTGVDGTDADADRADTGGSDARGADAGDADAGNTNAGDTDAGGSDGDGADAVGTDADEPDSDGAHRREPASDLVPLSDHLQRIVDSVQPLSPIQLSLLDSSGCALAADVVAREDIPPFDNSAMDGYAVVADAVDGWLPVSGEVAAGDEPRVSVEPGTAVRIMTGAALPAGATAVVPVELVEEDGERIRVLQAPEPGAHIRRAGESVAADDTVLVAGTVLDAASIGMLAALGHSYVSVFPHPRVVIVSTGDELSEPGTQRTPGAIYDANSYVLTVLARDSGAQTVRRMIASDDRGQLREAIEELLPHADLLVTTGGVSAGRYDLVKVVLAELGDVQFHKVGMRPGMPQAFGFIEADPGRVIPCFGLPGNPVSAYVSFEVFVRPTIRRMQGRRDLSRPRISAAIEAPIDSVSDKVEFVRVTLRRRDGEWQARPTGDQGSGILRSLVEADGLAEVPSDRDRLDIGERVVVHLLRSV